MSEKFRVLLIYPGGMPPKPEAESNMEFFISKYCSGDLIGTHWGSRGHLPPLPLSDIYGNLGSFRYHATFDPGLPKALKFFWDLSYFIREGLWLSVKSGRFQAIVTYGPYTCGMAGWVIRVLTGSRLIIMMPATPIESFKFVKTKLGRIKYLFARTFIPPLIRGADAAWLLYPSQLDGLPGGGPSRVHVFPDFTPTTGISHVPVPENLDSDPYVLFLGHPFHRKGVDLLLKAFRTVGPKHPRVRLRVVGHCPDLAPYREMAGDGLRISFERPTMHDEAMRLVAGCSLFVLPSRLEGVPRAVVEAMALGKPVVASRINGTPTVLEDGRDGLLFESENVKDLAEKMDQILSNPQLAKRFGESARKRVLTELSSENFASRFRDMIADVVAKPASQHQDSKVGERE